MKSSHMTLAVMCIAGLCHAIIGQTGSPVPKFEAASIKAVQSPSMGVGTGAVRPLPGGRLRADQAILRYIIQVAYGVRNYQVVGGPNWVDSDHFDIDATAGTDATPQQELVMLQSLLEDRFKLKVHRETRELPVYELTLAKGGMKVPLKTEACPEATDPTPYAGPGQPIPLACGRVQASLGVDSTTGKAVARMNGKNVAMTEFVRVLSNLLGRTIIDRTMITNTFDLQIAFARDEAIAPRLNSNVPAADPDPSTATVFTVLPQELGLKLDSAKGPVEVIAIESVEKPISNGGVR